MLYKLKNYFSDDKQVDNIKPTENNHPLTDHCILLNESMRSIKRKITGAYVDGFDVIKLRSVGKFSDDQEDAIRELISPLIKKGLANSEEELHKAILEREAHGSTAIGNGIAIPHAETTSIKEKVIVFGRSKKSINFDAIDNKPVNLFFMIISPSREICPHLKTLARISRLLRNKTFRDDWSTASWMGTHSRNRDGREIL